METRRPRNSRNNIDRILLDKRMDKLLETGRQFVDGVSGARPGKRRNFDFQEISKKKVKNVGRWVTNKMDLFFVEEDNEDWYEEENNYEEVRDFKSFARESKFDESISNRYSKRPLEALSLRQSQWNENKKLPYSKQYSDNEEWPEDKDLKVGKWQRSNNKSSKINFDNNTKTNHFSNGRSIPRSRRRRT